MEYKNTRFGKISNLSLLVRACTVLLIFFQIAIPIFPQNRIEYFFFFEKLFSGYEIVKVSASQIFSLRINCF